MYKQKQNTTFHRQQTIYTLINIIMIIMKHKLLVHLKNYPSCQIPRRHKNDSEQFFFPRVKCL